MNVRVHLLNPNRLKKVQRELGYLTGDAFLRTIPLADFGRDIEQFLKDNSPSSSEGEYARFRASIGHVMTEGRFLKFAESWRVRRETSSNKVSFKIWNLLETIGGKEGEAKFRSIEYGSKTTSWIVRNAFKVKIKGDWVTLAAGRSVTHTGTEAANVQGKVADYIEDVIRPQVGERVREAVWRRLK
jgi:hypothetical protein